MKPNFITQMKAEIALKMELKYAALYQAKMRMTLQLAQDAAMIAANEVLQLDPDRAEEFALAFMETINDIGILMHDDQKDDKDYIYTRGVVDRKLKKICGDKFQPWEERYGQE